MIRYALRILKRNPGFSAIVILILAAGIGANTAMFSLVDGVLLRSLPFPDPGKLYAIQEVVPRFAHLAPTLPVSAHHYSEWRKQWKAAAQIALIGEFTLNLTSDGEPERLTAARITADFFPMLGIQPQLGRTFLEEEGRPGSDQVVILGDGLWRRRFHADPGVLGRKIVLDGIPYEIVGVLPPGLQVPGSSQLQNLQFGEGRVELWKPFALRESELSVMGDFNYGSIVRLKDGVSASRALDELNAIQESIVRILPERIELRATLVPLQNQITGRSRQGLLLPLAAVGAVLLIVCVNIANLLLSRATGRRREFAIRLAMGSSAGRLMRQMLVESMVLAALGGLAGVGIAYGALQVILSTAPAGLPRLNEVHLDARMLGVALLLSVVSALLFGLLPAWRSSRTDPQAGLRAGGRSATEGVQTGRLRAVLVSLEVGLSTVSLVAAGLLHVDKGFDVDRVMTVSLNFPSNSYPDLAKRSEFLRQAIDRVRSLPGVTAAGVSSRLPLSGEGGNNLILLEGVEGPILERPLADYRSVNADYFRVMGIPLRQGRIFDDADRKRGEALVSELTAQRFWPGQNPIGKRFKIGDPNNPLIDVIGVVGDVRKGLQKPPGPTVYIPYWRRGREDMALVVRTAIDPAAIATAVRREIQKLDAALPVPQFQTMQQMVSQSVAERRFQLTLVLLFAGVALALASLGIYGVVSYSVAQRRGEMGIRMALGATPSDLRALVLRQGLAPVLAGLACGLAGAIAVGRVLRGLLFGVTLADPLTLVAVSAVLLVVATAACYVPAFRATRANLLEVL